MSAYKQTCDSETLVRYLDEQLDPTEQTAIEEHLSDCALCQHEIDTLAAEPRWWDEARLFLAPGQPGDDAPLGPAGTCWSGVVDDLVSPQPAVPLHFLAPTDDPHMLGRIGGYDVAGVVGCGGMGIVLKAYDAALNRFVAIKVLAPHLATSGAARQRFAREAVAAAAVVHENVIAIHNVAEDNGLPFLVMPYERGASLQKRLNDGGPLGLTEVLRISMQMADGLSAAHAQGLVHRDIKPANILLDEGTERVKITDFGLARAVDDASLTYTGVIAGTPQFMSPEQARGDGVDHRSDLFSLGSVMYAMCAGHPPFRAETSYGVLRRICEDEPRDLQEQNPAIPAWFCEIVRRLHSKSPDDRFTSAAELCDLLGQCLAHVQQPTSIPLPESLQRPVNKRRSKAWLSLLLGCLLTVGASWGLLAALSARSTPSPMVDDVPKPGSKGTQPTSFSAEELRWEDGVDSSLLELDSELRGLENRSEKLTPAKPLQSLDNARTEEGRGDESSTETTK